MLRNAFGRSTGCERFFRKAVMSNKEKQREWVTTYLPISLDLVIQNYADNFTIKNRGSARVEWWVDPVKGTVVFCIGQFK
jgi:hypothetical protein